MKTRKTEAIKQFKAAENQKLIDKQSPPLCYIFGDKSLEFKIRDMLENAKESVYCRTSEKYLKYIEKLAKKDIKVHLVIMSSDPGAQKRLENLFKKGNAQIQTINMGNNIMKMVDTAGEEARKRMSSMVETMDLENMFVLVVDEAELLIIPPLKSDSLSAITITNKAMVCYMLNQMLKPNTEERNKANEPV